MLCAQMLEPSLDLEAEPAAPPMPKHREPAMRTLASVQREASDSTTSLVDLANRCELDDRQDLSTRRESALTRPKSKPSDLNLANMDKVEPQQKKKRAAIHWHDLKDLRFAGEGAHCTVHTATLDGKPVAVKLLKQEQRSDPVAIRDLECEAELMAGMTHEHVMKLIGSGVQDDCTFLVMERLHSTLAETLAKTSRAIFPGRAARKQWPVSRSLAVAEQLARAMVYVHDEAYPDHALLHRDLKPDNIGFADDGRVLLFDFGLAKLIPRQCGPHDEPVEMTGKTGSARYMAPEVALSKPYNGKADVHSFAMILYQMAAHEKPFSGMDLEMLYTDVIYGGARPKIPKQWPASLSSLLKDCWHPDPDCRPDFSEVRRRLQLALAQEAGS